MKKFKIVEVDRAEPPQNWTSTDDMEIGYYEVEGIKTDGESAIEQTAVLRTPDRLIDLADPVFSYECRDLNQARARRSGPCVLNPRVLTRLSLQLPSTLDEQVNQSNEPAYIHPFDQDQGETKAAVHAGEMPPIGEKE